MKKVESTYNGKVVFLQLPTNMFCQCNPARKEFLVISNQFVLSFKAWLLKRVETFFPYLNATL